MRLPLLCTLVSLFLYFAGSAQTYLGIKTGVCIPNLKGSSSAENPIANDWSSRLGPYTGLVAAFRLADHFSLQTEINYSSQGGKKKGKQTIATASLPYTIPPGVTLPKYLYANIDATAILNYIELPILASGNFHLTKKLDFFVNAGPYIGYLFNAKTVSKGSSMIYEDAAETSPFIPAPVNLDMKVDIMNELNRFNMGLQFGAGIEYKIKNASLKLTGGGNIGITNIQKNKSNGENKTGAGTIAVCYLHKL